MQSLRRNEFASLFSEGISTELDDAPGAKRRRRDAIFREELSRWCDRQITGASDISEPLRTIGLRELVRAMLQAHSARRPSAGPREPGHPAGFCGFGSDLSPPTLISASHGGVRVKGDF
jgi:hypothetical protein